MRSGIGIILAWHSVYQWGIARKGSGTIDPPASALALPVAESPVVSL